MAEPPPGGELGCAGVLAAVDVVVLGYGALTLGRLGQRGFVGQPSVWGWWVALFVTGALAPAIALATVARRSRRGVIGLTLSA